MSVKLPPLLVVDDEKNMRLSLEAVMADEGYEVRAVDSAEQALRLLEQEDFFMIITDARLNGMSGYEFLGQLKYKWSNLPVLMITAFATPKLGSKQSRPARLITWRNRSRRRNCSTPSPAARSGIG